MNNKYIELIDSTHRKIHNIQLIKEAFENFYNKELYDQYNVKPISISEKDKSEIDTCFNKFIDSLSSEIDYTISYLKANI